LGARRQEARHLLVGVSVRAARMRAAVRVRREEHRPLASEARLGAELRMAEWRARLEAEHRTAEWQGRLRGERQTAERAA
jgi:hypothetical protein